MDTTLNESFADGTREIQDQVQSGIFGFVQEHTLLTFLMVLLVSLYLVASNFTPTAGLDEPPLISHPIPFFGHLLGIVRHGIKYFDQIGQQANLPIFTLPILNNKAYVITSPELVTACMRETRTLSFNPFITEVFRRMAHLSPADMDITKANMDNKSQPGYMTDMQRAEYAALAPGPALSNMHNDVLGNLTSLLQQALPADEREVEVDLFATLRQTASLAALRAVYGPSNPFDKVPSLISDFWLFERDLKFLLLDFFPNITVRKAHQARQRLTAAFLQYYSDGSHLQASAVIQERYAAAVKYGQKQDHIAAFDVGFCFGILGNAMPTVFWMLMYVYSDAKLLQALRDETAHLLSTDRSTSDVAINLHSDGHLRHACPLLTSTFHETLRVVSSSLSSGRYVLHDTMLTVSSPSPPPHGASRSYLLKAHSTIQIPSHPLHYPPPNSPSRSPFTATATGTPPSTFDPHRFASLGAKTAAEPERSINGSFRAFGGGGTLCPGRKFAFVEIVGAVVVFVQGFEVWGLDRGRVRVPGMDGGKVALAVAKPDGGTRVRVARREGWGGRRMTGRVGG